MTENQEPDGTLTSRTIWLLVAKTIGFVASIALPLIIVRLLDKSDIGIYRQIFLVLATCVSIVPLGFSMSAYYFLPRESADRKPFIIFNILLFNLVASAFVGLILTYFPQILGGIFQSEIMAHYSPLIGLALFFMVFSLFLETVAIANQEKKLAAGFIVFAQVTKTIMLAAAVFAFSSVEAIVWMAIAQGVLQTAVLLVYLNSRFPKFWRSFDPALFREQAFYALPFGFSVILFTLQTDLHNYFVGYKFNEADFAVYAIGCFNLPLIGILLESINSVLIPRMSQLQRENNFREMIELTARAIKKLALIYFPLCIFFLITAEEFILTLFTQKFADSVPIFRVNLLLIPFFILLADPITRAYKELGHFLLLMRMVLFIFLVPALWFGIQYLDLTGIISIVVIFSILDRTITMMKAAQKIGVSKKDWRLLIETGKVAMASMVAGILTFVVHYFLVGLLPILILTICATVFGLAYIGAIFWLKALSDDENTFLLKQIERLRDLFGIRSPKPEIQN